MKLITDLDLIARRVRRGHAASSTHVQFAAPHVLSPYHASHFDSNSGRSVQSSKSASTLQAQISPLEHFYQDAAHPSPKVRLSVLLHPYTPESLLERLLEAEVCALPGFLAGFTLLCQQRPLSNFTLERLAQHPLLAVRQGVLGTHTLPHGVLERLASDPDPLVRAAVAGHPRAGGKRLVLLAADADSNVRDEVLHNPRSPESVVVLLRSRPLLEHA